MSRAIDMAQYYLSQYELIMAANSPQTGLTGVLLKIFNYLKGKADGTTIGKLKAGIRSLRGVDKTEIQSHCHWLVENGYAVLDGKKIKLVDTVDKKLTPLSTAEPLIYQGVERKVDKVDKLTNHSSHPMGITKDAVSVAPPIVDAVNFCNLSTDHLETTVNQGVDVVDKKVDASTTSVNFSQEDLLALEQTAPTSADNCGASVVDTPVVDATPNPSPLSQKLSIEVAESTVTEEAIAPTTPVENAAEPMEAEADEQTPQSVTAKPATEAITVTDDGWKEGDRVVVDASELPPSLRGFDGRRGIVDRLKQLSEQCYVDFGGDEFMHIPFRGLRRAEAQ
jgi:hypothetical protein